MATPPQSPNAVDSKTARISSSLTYSYLLLIQAARPQLTGDDDDVGLNVLGCRRG